MSGFDSKQDYDEGRADDELLRPYIPGRDWPRAPLPPPVIREQLAEEMAKVRQARVLWEFGGSLAEGNFDVEIAGLGIFRLNTEQARQLGSALLAEVEIALRAHDDD